MKAEADPFPLKSVELGLWYQDVLPDIVRPYAFEADPLYDAQTLTLLLK